MDKSGCKKIIAHLLGTKEDGSDVIGVYPLLPNGTCRFIVFDFDNHEKGAEVTDFANTDNEWHKEVDALRKMCELNGIRPLVERSRSGKGAHVWIFFKKANSKEFWISPVRQGFDFYQSEIVSLL